MSKRRGRGPNLTEQLCGALIQIAQMRAQIDGCEPAFTWEQSKRMTNKQIRSHFECDHHPLAAWLTNGIPCNKPWNLTWRLKPEHRAKTARIDVPAAAKSKRILAKLDVVIAADATQKRQRPKRAWPKRSFSDQRRRYHDPR